MTSMTSFLKPLALAAMLVATASSQAAITIYDTAASFAAATSAPGVDTFADISTTLVTIGELTRSVGAYGYKATVPGNFYGSGPVSNPALSVNNSRDTITFDTFTGGVQALGGNFYATSDFGTFIAGSLLLTATDASGTITRTITPTSADGFWGFVSSTAVTSMTISPVEVVGINLYATVDNLVLAKRSVTVVPEPQTYALFLAGLAGVGLVARRRRA
jgi:hypothetical protein